MAGSSQGDSFDIESHEAPLRQPTDARRTDADTRRQRLTDLPVLAGVVRAAKYPYLRT